MTPTAARIIQTETEARVRQGWQCPECYGVRIETRVRSMSDPHIEGFLCIECGCQFGSR